MQVAEAVITSEIMMGCRNVFFGQWRELYDLTEIGGRIVHRLPTAPADGASDLTMQAFDV